PSEAMKETFRPVSIGNCRSAEPRLIENQYVFPLRCDYMGPVRTVIAIKSDEAYTEVNELTVGNFPRTDTVTARRVGECVAPDSADSVKSAKSSLRTAVR